MKANSDTSCPFLGWRGTIARIFLHYYCLVRLWDVLLDMFSFLFLPFMMSLIRFNHVFLISVTKKFSIQVDAPLELNAYAA